MRADRPRKPRPPLDEEGLERLALFYAGRYATTRARLSAYLRRKLAERGWSRAGQPPVERLVERFVALGYVDDGAFAAAKAVSLARRGYGERRLNEALRAAGIAEEDAEAAREVARGEAYAAALRFAKRRRIGPYASGAADPSIRGKAAAAMLRAGHSVQIVRRVLDAGPDDVPDPDSF